VVEAAEALDLPGDHVPQHEEVNARLRSLTGFRFTPAGGIVDDDRMYGAMADGWFHAAQYLRHPAVPLYSPEPDALHDLAGHGPQLASPRFAALYRLFGEAARRARTTRAVEPLSRMFWFTMEYGLVKEGGRLRAYGAALLSSYGEIARFPAAERRPLDPVAVVATPYTITGYQPVLYVAESLDHLADMVGAFCADLDGDTPSRLASQRPTPQV
jgi:phenylalanine-4-hydroxylase